MSSSPDSQPPATGSRKRPNLWAVAGVTYGVVIGVAVLSIAVYYYYASTRQSVLPQDEARSLMVGSVWVPIYPGSLVQRTAIAGYAGDNESALAFESSDDASRLLEFYRKGLSRAPFRFATVQSTAEGGRVHALAREGKTTIVVSIRTTAAGSQGEITTVDRDAKK